MDIRESLLTPKLIDALYTEAMVLADEARSYFESGRFHEDSDPDDRLAVSFSCESLKVTTRLMHCIAWLLNQKALHSGELTAGEAPVTQRSMTARFPEEARQIIRASEDLFQRLQRLATKMDQELEAESAVQDMFRRLKGAF